MIVHYSTVHKGLDIRIFYKQCLSLKAQGYQIALAMDLTRLESATCEERGIQHIPIKTHGNFIMRNLFTNIYNTYKVLKRKPQIIHFHDPELVIIMGILSLFGYKIIYDMHEDFQEDVKLKGKGLIFDTFIAPLLTSIEFWISVECFYIICATNHIKSRYILYTDQISVIKNYPLKLKINSNVDNTTTKTSKIVYIGDITPARGYYEMVRIAELLGEKFELCLIGKVSQELILHAKETTRKLKNIRFLGFISYDMLFDYCRDALCGIILLHPIETFKVSLPTKIFDYMNFGLPIICSDFKHFRVYFRDHDCITYVEPYDIHHIVKKIINLTADTANYKRQSIIAKQAIANEFSWENQAVYLNSIYSDL